MRKSQGHDNAIKFMKKLFQKGEIIKIGKKEVISTLNSIVKDYEDAVQIEAAKMNQISIIITRNKKDFINSGLNIYTPKEYIDLK